MHIEYKIIDKPKDKAKEIELFIREVSIYFTPPLDSKVDISAYSRKLALKSTVAFAFDRMDKNKLVGLLAYYRNNNLTKEAYLSVFSVLPEYQGMGIGKRLLTLCLHDIKTANFAKVRLETWSKNAIVKTYQNLGFKIWNRVTDRPEENETLKMELILN
jgi:ribosomal protein S18 acetylase RimI-like enzyme